ncbi:MAG: sialidase family protein, partial [Holophaga sp.]
MSLRSLIPSLALLIASGALLAQETTHQTQPDPSLKFHYKRFFRGDDKKIVDEAWGRNQWWLERMGGELGPDFYQHYIREAEKERARYPMLFPRPGVAAPVAITPAAWVNIGPTTAAFATNGVTLNIVDSGRGRVILPHPTDVDTLYFLNAGGGLWKTTNFTAADTTWTPTTDSVGSTAGGSVAFGRTPSTLYLGTGDPFDGGVGGFIVKSTDAAASWSTAVFLTGATKVYDLKVDTSGGQDIVLVGTNAGMFRSADGGATFTSVGGTNLNGKQVWSLVQTSIGWLASVKSGTSSALYYSGDQGATWNPITNAGTVYTGAGRSTLAVGAPGDAIVYCFAANTSDAAQLDLFKSTNGGQTWVALGITSKTPTNPNTDQADMDVMAGQAFYNHMIVVDPTDSSRNTVILGGQLSTARTTDGGTTWTLLTNWLPNGAITLPYAHADHHCAAFTTVGGTKRLILGHDGGITVSADGGATFDDKKNNGLASHLIYALAVNPKLAGSALVGLQDNGTRSRVLTPTPSTTYNQIKGGDGFGVGWAPGSGVSIATYVYNKISRSTANPATQSSWSAFTSGLPAGTGSDSNTYYFATPIITPTEQADPTGQVFFTYGKKGIYKSSSTAWTTIGTPGVGGISIGRV